MRSTQAEDFTITYPSEMVFAFNRNIIKMELCRSGRYAIHVGDFTDVRDIIGSINNGYVKMDISRYLQLAFSREDILGGTTAKQIEVNICSEDDEREHFNFELYVLWGAVNPQDSIKDCEDVIVDGKINFFGFSYDCIKTYLVGKSGAMAEVISADRKNGINSIALEDYGMEDEDWVIVDNIISADRSSFDTSFDYTFLWTNIDRVRYKFVRECNNGMAVKWVDNYGLWHQRNFLAKGERMTTSIIGNAWDDFSMSADDATYGWYGMTRQQGFSTKNEKTIVIPSASEEEWHILKTLINAPIVQAEIYGEWHDVNVSAGTMEMPTKHYEDFAVAIQLPNIVRQTL